MNMRLTKGFILELENNLAKGYNEKQFVQNLNNITIDITKKTKILKEYYVEIFSKEYITVFKKVSTFSQPVIGFRHFVFRLV